MYMFKSLFAERCMASAFRVVYFRVSVHCLVAEFPVAPVQPISSLPFTSSAMNKENHRDLSFKASLRGLQFRNTVQMLEVLYNK